MDQKRIMEILAEASKLGVKKAKGELSDRERGTAMERLVTLSQELEASVPEGEVGSKSTEVVYGLLHTLFFGTLQARPEHLPQLFPFFAALLSDKNHYLGSAPVPIEWDLLFPKK